MYRGSLFSIFTTLIYHKVLVNNKTEQDTEQDKQTQILVDACILPVDANQWCHHTYYNNI